MSEIKVGDELAFQWGLNKRWGIFQVQRITPTGLIKCGHWTVNPDLSIRGRGYTSPFRAHLPTPHVREQVRRQWLTQRLQLAKPENLTTDQLERIAAILAEETC